MQIGFPGKYQPGRFLRQSLNMKSENDTYINKQILKGSVIALISNLGSRGFQIISRGLISRLTGVSGLGQFELILSLTRWLALIGQNGAHQTIVQFVSSRKANRNWNDITNIFIQSLLLVIATTFSLLLLLWLVKDQVSDVLFEGYGSLDIVIIVIGLTVLLSLAHYLGSFFRGLKFFILDQVTNTAAFPVVGLVVFTYGYFIEKESFNLVDSFWIILFIYAGLIMAIFLFALGYLISKVEKYTWKSFVSEITGYSWPIWINSILNATRAQFSRLLIPIFSTTAELGYFSSAYAIAFLASILNTSFTPVNQTLVAEAYGKHDFAAINTIYNNILLKTSYFLIAGLGGILIFGKLIILIVYGAGFETAYTMLVILALSEAVNSLAGPSGNVLLMTGNQKISTRIMFIGFITLAVLSLILIPFFGALGAAIAAASSVIIINLQRIYYLRVRLHVYADVKKLLRRNKHLMLLVITTAIFKVLGLLPELYLLVVYGIIVTILIGRRFLKI